MLTSRRDRSAASVPPAKRPSSDARITAGKNAKNAEPRSIPLRKGIPSTAVAPAAATPGKSCKARDRSAQSSRSSESRGLKRSEKRSARPPVRGTTEGERCVV